ncbi:MAG: dehydrogenase, partial [Pseudomonas stutzeri]|nr:dehydrogenase [Stutzerimonas stutzeri]
HRCIDKWAQHAPNLPDAIIDWTPHTPLDIPRRITNMVRGDWMGGIIALDNLLTERPFPELSQ